MSLNDSSMNHNIMEQNSDPMQKKTRKIKLSSVRTNQLFLKTEIQHNVAQQNSDPGQE